MYRREFCKLLGSGAVALPFASPAMQGQTSGDAEGFDQVNRSYADFCATPAEQRVFYKLENGKIVTQKLDDTAWKPSAWGEPPVLPVPGGSWDGVPMNSPIPDLAGEGPYKPTWESLLQYDTPEWYQDAKFGIWAHWSPQCVPEAGDWYARKMYSADTDSYKNQLAHYGHPSKFGYKDLCAQWTLLNWDPEALIQKYKQAGAKLFIALANHHDGFDTWNSKYQPWNAANLGPHRDVIGEWAAMSRKYGLRFGVTVHQARNWWWFQTSHGADASGPLAGVPYDGQMTQAEGKEQWWQGLDPQALYAPKHPADALPDPSYVKNFYDRTRDLIDQHDPDLLYFDNSLVPLGWAGMNIAAYFYNHNLKTRGKMEAILNGKQVPDNLAKALVADYERGLTEKIMPYVWQSETCIGDWHYDRKLFDKAGEYGGYTPPRDIIHWMIDTVSKNGTFIVNVPGKPDGAIDSKEAAFIDQMGAWMQLNGEAIYATRPWKIYGEGPNAVKSGSFQGNSVSRLGSQDIRFTRNKSNTVIYAIALGWPTEPVMVRALGTAASTNPGKVAHVEVLGTQQKKVEWKQEASALRVKLPANSSLAAGYAAAIKVTLA